MGKRKKFHRNQIKLKIVFKFDENKGLNEMKLFRKANIIFFDSMFFYPTLFTNERK